MPQAQLIDPPAADVPLLQRDAALLPETFDKTTNEIEVVCSTGARGTRSDYYGEVYDEELEVTTSAVDLSRVDAGVVQVLDSHQQYAGVAAILGVVKRAWVANGELRAILKLSSRPEMAGIVSDIAGGIIRGVSVGYRVLEWLVKTAEERGSDAARPLRIAKRWALYELSFVPVPFDAGASTRALGSPTRSLSGEHSMPEPVQTREAIDTEIRSLCQRFKLTEREGDAYIRAGLSVQQVKDIIIERRAADDEAAGGHRNARGVPTTQHAEDATTLMAEALSARMGGPACGAENPYRHVTPADMAREMLERGGIRTTAMTPAQIVGRMMTTSDFPELLTAAGNRTLRAAYQSYQGGLKRVCKEATAPDFRAKQRLQLGEAPTLLQVNEAGEFKYGGMAEAKTSYALATYGRIISLSRQAIINDDLDAFGDLVVRMARAASEFEAQFLVTLLTSNPTMNDNVALFHANHGNLQTGAGSALQVSSLTTARKNMRLQKGLDGSTPIDAMPKYLIVPAALETTAEQLLADLAAATVADVNPFAGRLELVVDPRLDAASATAWYLAAAYSTIDTIEYSYLDQAAGPQIEAKPGWEVDGVEMKIHLDFGGGVLDWRGLQKANGA